MRLSCFLLFAAPFLCAEDLLETDKPSPAERRKRADALALWKKTADVRDAVALGKRGELPPPERLREAMGQIEDVVLQLERSLRREWNGAANDQLVLATKAWFKLREIVPPAPTPEDPDARKKAKKRADRARRERVRAARKFVLDYYKARRYSALFHRCRSCDGRKQKLDPFGGEPRECTTCAGAGKLLNKKVALQCSWLAHSPLYRAKGRNENRVNRLADDALRRPERLGPFVDRVSVKGKLEDHNVWVRVKLESRKRVKPDEKPNAKELETVVVYRVGKVWYLYDRRHDGKVLKIEDEDGQ